GPKSYNVIDKSSSDIKFKGQATLSIINKEMEKFSQIGKLNKSTFKELKKIIDMYLYSIKTETSNDDSLKLEDMELDEFETFLEFCNILIDATPTIEKSLIEVVS